MANNNEKRQAEIIINGQKAEATLKDMAAATAVLNKQINDLTPGSEKFVKKSEQLQQVKKRYKEVRAEVNGVDASTKKAKTGFLGITSATDLMKKGFDFALKSLLPLLAVQKLIEVAQHVLGIESAYTRLSGTIQKVTGLQGEVLHQATIQVNALTNSFEVGEKEIIKAANAISKEFGITVPQALAKVEKGLIAAEDKSEFLNQATEYATQFREAGFEAEDFVAQLIRAEQEGIFSDKGADTIKEFGLRIREQTKASKDALNDAFGAEFTGDLFKGINDGSITTEQALERVAEKMNDTTIPANKLQTVIADVFGGPGEDAGLRYIQTLTEVGGNVDDLIDRTNPYVAQQEAQLELQKELAAAEAELAEELQGSSEIWDGFTTNLQIFGTKVLVGLVKGFDTLKTTLFGIGNVLTTLSTNFRVAYGALISGDFDLLKDIGSNLGTQLSQSFNNAFIEEEQIQAGRRAAEKEKQTEEEKAQAEKTASEQAKAVAEVNKKEAEKIRKAREVQQKAELEAVKAIEDLKVEAIANTTDRQIAKINLDTQRKIEALKGSEEQITEQKLLLEQQRDEKLREVQEQLREQEKQAEAERFAEQEEERLLLEEQEQLLLEEKYINGILKEEEYQNALFELQKQALDSKLALLQQSGQAESAEAQKLKNQIIKIENDKAKSAVEFEKRKVEAKKQLSQVEVSAIRDTTTSILGFFSEMRNAEGEQTKAAKLAGKANIALQGALEVQRIWASVGSIPPPVGPILGALQTGIAVARTVNAIRKVDNVSTSFATGGHTGPGTIRDHTGHKVAGVVHDGEYVVPKWINQDPVYADVIGMLETVRLRGSYATGGDVSSSRTTQTTQPAPQTGQFNAQQQTEMMSAKLDMMIEILESWPNELKVINSVNDTVDKINTLNEIINDGSIS